MKNIQLERRYLHKKHIHNTSTIKSVKSYLIHYKFFSLLAPRKGIGALAPFIARMRTKTLARKENI